MEEEGEKKKLSQVYTFLTAAASCAAVKFATLRSIPFHIVILLMLIIICCTLKIDVEYGTLTLDHYHQHTITNVLYTWFHQLL